MLPKTIDRAIEPDFINGASTLGNQGSQKRNGAMRSGIETGQVLRGAGSADSAARAKAAGRAHAAAVSKEEVDDLILQRKRLIQRKLAGEISRPENNKLAFIQWSLDTIEEARMSQSLDLLEQRVSAYEGLAKEMQVLQDRIKQLATRPPRR